MLFIDRVPIIILNDQETDLKMSEPRIFIIIIDEMRIWQKHTS